MVCCIKGCNSRRDKKGLEKKNLFTPRTVNIYVGFILRKHIGIILKMNNVFMLKINNVVFILKMNNVVFMLYLCYLFQFHTHIPFNIFNLYNLF